MLDIRLFREQPDLVREGLRRVGADPALVDEVLRLDVRRRELITETDRLKAERNAGSKDVAQTKDKAERDAKIAAMRAIGDRVAELDGLVARAEADLDNLMLDMKNLPHPDVPYGTS